MKLIENMLIFLQLLLKWKPPTTKFLQSTQRIECERFFRPEGIPKAQIENLFSSQGTTSRHKEASGFTWFSLSYQKKTEASSRRLINSGCVCMCACAGSWVLSLSIPPFGASRLTQFSIPSPSHRSAGKTPTQDKSCDFHRRQESGISRMKRIPGCLVQFTHSKQESVLLTPEMFLSQFTKLEGPCFHTVLFSPLSNTFLGKATHPIKSIWLYPEHTPIWESLPICSVSLSAIPLTLIILFFSSIFSSLPCQEALVFRLTNI